MSVNVPVPGSNIDRWRFDCATGNALADGCADPSLQNAGFSAGRTREVNHTRPRSSIIGLCASVWLSQIGSGPQYGDGPNGFVFDEGVRGSRTGCSTSLTLCVPGSSIGSRSVLSSADAYTFPLALTRGFRRSVEMASCRYAVG